MQGVTSDSEDDSTHTSTADSARQAEVNGPSNKRQRSRSPDRKSKHRRKDIKALDERMSTIGAALSHILARLPTAPQQSTVETESVEVDNTDVLSTRASHSYDSEPDHSMASVTLTSEGEKDTDKISLADIFDRACKHLNVQRPPAQPGSSSKFDEFNTSRTEGRLPLFDDYVRELQRTWDKPNDRSPAMPGLCTRLSSVHGADENGFGHFPRMDSAFVALVLPTSLRHNTDPELPNKRCRASDRLLRRAHDSASSGARLGNSAAILAFYQKELQAQCMATPKW